MTKNYRHYTWFIWSILHSLAFILILGVPYQIYPFHMTLAYILLIISWVQPITRIVFSKQYEKIIENLRILRETAPLVTWLLTILLLVIYLLVWGHVHAAEYDFFLLISWFYSIAILWFMGSKEDDWRNIGASLSATKWTNVFLLITTVLLSFATVELTMRWTMLESHGFGRTLQSEEWAKRYFKPVNSFGYRDNEPVAAKDDQKSIMVLGDSFVVGHGIRNIDDIFAFQLNSILGDNYITYVVGFSGISPTIDYVTNYPYEPDILVLSHFVNDIDHTLENDDTSSYTPPPFVSWWTHRYFLASFAYWHLYIANQLINEYSVSVLAPYENEAQWLQHAEQLQEFVDWAEENDKQLIVLIWPTLENLEASQFSDAKVADFFEEQGVPVVLMSEHLEHLSVTERTVNRLDSHPNELSHHLAAEALAEVIEQLED